jgi:hypothetical protein
MTNQTKTTRVEKYSKIWTRPTHIYLKQILVILYLTGIDVHLLQVETDFCKSNRTNSKKFQLEKLNKKTTLETWVYIEAKHEDV